METNEMITTIALVVFVAGWFARWAISAAKEHNRSLIWVDEDIRSLREEIAAMQKELDSNKQEQD